MTALDQDPRWSDVNVISSLLKSFFRKLPDALLTSELYPNFIKSDAIEDAIQRMMAIRKLVGTRDAVRVLLLIYVHTPRVDSYGPATSRLLRYIAKNPAL